MKRIATYSRVSTVDQKIDMQLDGLRKYAEMKEVKINVNILTMRLGQMSLVLP
jgi:DNA invertase Pin-like site-specific DNA recombinase